MPRCATLYIASSHMVAEVHTRKHACQNSQPKSCFFSHFPAFDFFYFTASMRFMRYGGTAFTACYIVLRMHWMLSTMGISHAHSVLAWFTQEDLLCFFVRGLSLDLCCNDWAKGSVYLTIVWSCDESMLCHCTHVFMFECVYWYKTHSYCYLWNSNIYMALNANPIYLTCSLPAEFTYVL